MKIHHLTPKSLLTNFKLFKKKIIINTYYHKFTKKKKYIYIYIFAYISINYLIEFLELSFKCR